MTVGLKKEYIDTVVPESTGGAGRSSGTAFVALPSVKIVIAGIVLAALQVAAMNGLLSSSFVYALGNTLIYAIVAIGFCLLLGYSGLASLGTAGFIGLGAYTAFYMIQGLGAPYYLTLLATLAISIAIGVIVGFISLRIEGIYLAIMTLALSEVIRNALMALKATIKIDITNVCLFGVNVNESAVYLLITFTFIVLMLLTSNLIRSPIGRAMIAMKNSTSAAQAMGVSLMKYRLMAFVISTINARSGRIALHALRPEHHDLHLYAADADHLAEHTRRRHHRRGKVALGYGLRHLRHLWPAVDVSEQDTVFHRQSGLYHDGDGPAHNRCCNVFPRRLRADGHVSAGLDKKAEGGKEAARLCQGSALMSADS